LGEAEVAGTVAAEVVGAAVVATGALVVVVAGLEEPELQPEMIRLTSRIQMSTPKTSFFID